MKFRLQVSEAGGTPLSLRNRLRGVRNGLNSAADRLADFGPAFKILDRRLDTQIKQRFRSNDWVPLEESTIDARDEGRGWYQQPGNASISPGRWTDKMYASLLGLGPQGSKFFSEHAYRRDYSLTGETYNGRDVAARALWFHEGTNNQPPRPFWENGERERIARDTINDFITERVIKKIQKTT